jgi:hypothetical protein
MAIEDPATDMSDMDQSITHVRMGKLVVLPKDTAAISVNTRRHTFRRIQDKMPLFSGTVPMCPQQLVIQLWSDPITSWSLIVSAELQEAAELAADSAPRNPAGDFSP